VTVVNNTFNNEKAKREILIVNSPNTKILYFKLI